VRRNDAAAVWRSSASSFALWMLALLSWLPAGAWGQSRFVPLGDLPGGSFDSLAQGISNDGGVAVGMSHSDGGIGPEEAFRWTAETGMQGLGSAGGLTVSGAHDTNADGSVIVGTAGGPFSDLTGFGLAFRWSGRKMIPLGLLNPFVPLSRAKGVSDDGAVVAGFSAIGSLSDTDVFRWTAGTGMVRLFASRPAEAEDISGDGAVIVGFANHAGRREAFRWTQGTGFYFLGSLAPATASVANATDRKGAVVVGGAGNAAGHDEAFRWAGLGLVGLGALPGESDSEALGVSSDGRTVVGTSGGRAFIWTREQGMQDVGELLVAAGIDLAGFQLLSAAAVADDGRTLVGEGVNGHGDPEGWLAVVELRSDLLRLRASMLWRSVQAGSGHSHSCGVLADGTVACWGANDVGQSSPPPGVFREVVTGERHSCGLRFDGEVRCWGSPGTEQSPASRPGPYRTLTAGSFHTCGVLAGSGRVECWGQDGDGQVSVPESLRERVFRSVTGGEAHTCGLLEDGTAVCWGRNDSDQATPPAGSFMQIDAGASHTCGLRADGAVTCWGSNSSGQRKPPADALFQKVSAGGAFTCGVGQDGALACWGANDAGQATPPAGVFSDVSAGGAHACGRHPDGTLECWGSNADGEATVPVFPVPEVAAGADFSCLLRSDNHVECFGDPSSSTPEPTQQLVQIDAGVASACGVQSDGHARCWGAGAVAPPAQVAFKQVAVATSVACGIRSDDQVQCWGSDGFGSASPPPLTFRQIDAGRTHFCGVTTDGLIACWGQSFGTPPLGSFAQVAVGDAHQCARRSDGGVVCWGDGGEHQLAAPEGTFQTLAAGAYHTCGVRTGGGLACWGRDLEGQSTPPAGDFVGVSAGDLHACAVRAGGAIACWGSNDQGQAAAPGDSDADGYADVDDNCPLVRNGLAQQSTPGVGNQTDSDGDHVGDACDVCPSTADPLQLDTDTDAEGAPQPDGVGDFCDVCPAVFDPDQQTRDGVGVACAPTRVFYTPVEEITQAEPSALERLLAFFSPWPAIAATTTTSLKLQIDCGANPFISQVTLGLVFPSNTLATDVNVGGGCQGPAVIGGNFCNAATKLGTTVDKTVSWAAGPGAPPLDPNNANASALYFHFEGTSQADGKRKLCTTGQIQDLGTIDAANLGSTLSPPFTVQGLEQLFPSYPPQTAISADGAPPVDPATVEFQSGSATPKVKLEIEPHATDPSKWLVMMTVPTGTKLKTVRFGLTGFTGVSPSQLEFVFCNRVDANDPTRRTCVISGTSTDPSSDFPPNVDVNLAETRGPAASLATGTVSGNTLYVSVTGNKASQDGVTLNPGLGTSPVLLATVRFLPPPGQPLRQPYITFQGVQQLLGNPFVPTLTSVTIAESDAQLRGSFSIPLDFDGDGFVNDFDNCVYVPEQFQVDTGGAADDLAAQPLNPTGDFPDGIGNRCQCGDTRGVLSTDPSLNDGKVQATDAAGIQDVLVGKPVDPLAAERASTVPGPDVDLRDWLRVQLHRQGRGPGLEPACVPAMPGS